jgi:hypothetical protein
VRGRAPIKGLRACDDLLSSTVASFSVNLVGVARSRLASRQPSRLASPAGAFVTCVARVLNLFSLFALFFPCAVRWHRTGMFASCEVREENSVGMWQKCGKMWQNVAKTGLALTLAPTE